MHDKSDSSIRHSSMPLFAAIVVVAALGFRPAQGAPTDASVAVRAQDAAGAADAFAGAIARGDRAAAHALLLPDVLIYESGETETSAAEYAGHHLPADIAFMAGMKREVLSRKTGGGDGATWVATKSRLRGQYKGKAVDLDSTETLILTLTDAGWRVAHIHWSSATHREPRAAP